MWNFKFQRILESERILGYFYQRGQHRCNGRNSEKFNFLPFDNETYTRFKLIIQTISFIRSVKVSNNNR